MKQTTAPQTTPSPGRGTAKSPVAAGSPHNPSAVFIGMALDMSWRLAIVVIVPIVGGYYLDQHFDSSPWLAIGGFVIAGCGVVAVLRRMLREAGKLPVPQAEKRS